MIEKCPPMTLTPESCRASLARLQAILPSRYAQWCAEDPSSHDYRVLAAILPDGQEGYDTAHRTGIIGQVFRTGRTLFAPDVAHHPLYDPFDPAITWELCFPVCAEGRLVAVVNLEGAGTLDIDHALWRRIGETLRQTAGLIPPSEPPLDADFCLVDTRRLAIQSEVHDTSGVLAVARAIARGGLTTLLVGDFPALLRERAPTLPEARRQGLGASYCFVGVDERLDLLPTGPDSVDPLPPWWPTANGRYAIVLIHAPAMADLSGL
jgi:hypothetical protein